MENQTQKKKEPGMAGIIVIIIVLIIGAVYFFGKVTDQNQVDELNPTTGQEELTNGNTPDKDAGTEKTSADDTATSDADLLKELEEELGGFDLGDDLDTELDGLGASLGEL